MPSLKSLFSKDLIFKSNATSKLEVFNEIGEALIDQGYVKENFIEGLIEREDNYPTGLDLKPVDKNLNSAAIPHTETEYCLDKAVAYVKLENEVEFYNMIKPTEKIMVKHLFFIINNEKTNQTNVLSGLMEFLTNPSNVNKLDELNNEDKILELLKQY